MRQKQYKNLLYIFVILFLLQNANSSCFNNPYDSCQCKIAVNKNDECVNECRSSEMMIDFSPKKRFKRCVECSELNLYLNSNGDECIISCPEGEITLEDSNKCLKSFEECPTNYFRSEQRQTCSTSCLVNTNGDYNAEIQTVDESTKIKFCITCPYTYKYRYYGKCSNCHHEYEQQNELTGLCQWKYDKCHGYLSQDEKYCWKNSCKRNEYPQKKVDFSNGSYIQCTACSSISQPYISSDQNSCVKNCGSNEFVDSYNKQCLAQIVDCSGYVSSDRNTCSYRCQKSEIPIKRQNGQSYIQCQKCPSDKPYVDSTLTKCVVSCQIDEILQEKYNTCLSSENYCSQYYEKQMLVRDQKKCLSKCPPQYVYSKQQKNQTKIITCEICQFYQYGKIQTPDDDDDGEIIKKCVDRCEFPEIFDQVKNKCILCQGFVKDYYCFETCPENKPFEISYSQYDKGVLIYTRRDCIDKCKIGFQQSDSNDCKTTCKEGEIKEMVNNKCIKKEDCKYYISKDLLECRKECGENEYSVKKNGINFCLFCYDLFLNSSSDNPSPQCLKNCPKEYPIIKIQGDKKTCSTKEGCGYFKMSSQNEYCSENCLEPDMLNYGSYYDFSCVRECPKFIRYSEAFQNLVCDSNCYSKISGNKYCIPDCNFFNEVESGNYCTTCNTYENRRYVQESNAFICVKNKLDENEMQQIIYSLKVLLAQKKEIKFQQVFNFYIEQFQLMLLGFQQGLLFDFLNEFVRMVFNMSQLLKNNKFMYKANVIDTPEIKIITQKLGQSYQKNFIKSFSYSQLKSDNPDLTNTSQNIGFIPEYNPISLQVFISKQNILCPEIYSPFQCLRNTEVVIIFEQKWERDPFFDRQMSSTEFTMFFDIKDDKNINQYVCLTTIDNIMKRSIKTQVSSNPKGIICTFKDNVTLFMDSENKFMECPQNLPNKLKNQCVKECPQLFDPLRQLCITSLKECSYLNDGGVSCVSSCTSEFPYKQKISKKQIICQQQCKKDQFIFIDEMVCLNERNECSFYLLDNKICSYQCPTNSTISKTEETNYISCKTNIQDNDLDQDTPAFVILIILAIICLIIYFMITFLKQQGRNIVQNILPQRQVNNSNQQQLETELVPINQTTQLLADYDQKDEQK